MARQQNPQVINLSGINAAPVQLSATSIIVTSFIVQNLIGSSDYLRIGNSSGQYFEIAPGKDFEYNGDNLDNGTSSYTDLSTWYVVAVSGTQTCNVIYLQGY